VTDQYKELIEGLSLGNLQKAKLYARFILEGMKSDNIWRDRMLNNLSLQFMELPSNISEFLFAENPAIIDMGRTVLSAKEQKIVGHVERMQSVSNRMAESGIRYLNSTLLYGKSGTGKTTLAKYIARKMDLPFICINISTIVGSYLGETSKRIAKIFEYAIKTKCILMMDEIDVIGISRNSNKDGASAERSSIVMSITQNIDSLPNSTILIAGTNRIDILDEALLRRFSLQQEIKLPDAECIEEICHRYVDGTDIKFSDTQLKDFSRQMAKDGKSKDFIVKRIIEAMAVSYAKNDPLNLSQGTEQTLFDF